MRVYLGRPSHLGCVCSTPADTDSVLYHCCRCRWTVLYHIESSVPHTDFPLKHIESTISYNSDETRITHMSGL